MPVNSGFIPTGMIVPVVTPMSEGGGVDHYSLSKLAEYFCSASGVSGLMTTSRVGEGLSLSPEEQVEVADTVAKAAGGSIPVLAAIDTRTVQDTVRRLGLLAAVGVDCAMLLPPLWLAWGQVPPEVVVEFYMAVGEGQQLPILLFQVPVRSYWLQPATVLAISKLPGVVGMKEGSFDRPLFNTTLTTLKASNPAFRILNGNDRFVAEAAAAGSDGAILGVTNVMPSRWAALLSAAAQGDLAAASTHEATLGPLCDLLFRDPILCAVARIKTILAETGLIRSSTVRGRSLGIDSTEAQALLEEYARVSATEGAWAGYRQFPNSLSSWVRHGQSR